MPPALQGVGGHRRLGTLRRSERERTRAGDSGPHWRVQRRWDESSRNVPSRRRVTGGFWRMQKSR